MRAENPSNRFGIRSPQARTAQIKVNTVFISLNPPIVGSPHSELGYAKRKIRMRRTQVFRRGLNVWLAAESESN